MSRTRTGVLTPMGTPIGTLIGITGTIILAIAIGGRAVTPMIRSGDIHVLHTVVPEHGRLSTNGGVLTRSSEYAPFRRHEHFVRLVN